MNKNEFIKELSQKTMLTEKEAKMALESTIDIITESLVNNNPVRFVGFGTFNTVKRAGRIARVPGTNKTIEVEDKTIVKFKVGKILKEAVSLQ